jgi:methylglyoxal synthase
MKTGVIIFFIDPRDAEENLPENRELFRMCAMEDKDLNLPTYYKTPILLINYRSAALWASNEAEGAKNEIPAAEKGDTLALIAHDNRKLDMCHFIVKHREKLKFFDRIITTGTTGEWVEKFLNLFGDINLRVERKKSGLVGGDVMISNEILEGQCQHVYFFLDPETAHPHEADIYALFRTCTFSGVTVNLRMTYHAAESWIKTVKV